MNGFWHECRLACVLGIALTPVIWVVTFVVMIINPSMWLACALVSLLWPIVWLILGVISAFFELDEEP